MIDLHCHFLPGIDDGAETAEQALDLCRAAVADGIAHAVMTPHIHAGVFENRKSLIESHVLEFRALLMRSGIPLSISAGAEVRIGPELIEMLEEDEVPFLGAVGADKVLLLELPHGQVPVGADRLVGWLRARGIRPLIAHPERNKDVMRSLDKIYPFVALGCLLQVTAGSLTGRFGAQAQQRAREMLEKDWVFAVATDAHNLEHRPPELAAGRAAVEKLADADLAEALTRTNPARLLGLPTDVQSPATARNAMGSATTAP
jgi:protein-tyrosine phosphatase